MRVHWSHTKARRVAGQAEVSGGGAVVHDGAAGRLTVHQDSAGGLAKHKHTHTQ